MSDAELNTYLITELSNLYDLDEARAISKQLMAFYNEKQGTELEQKVTMAIARLKEAEPIQYVLGEAWFYNMPFYVDKNVLIPRPETEELVHKILSAVSLRSTQLTILDIGTGTGCIPISLKTNLPDAEVFAMDISKEALAIAEQNALRNRVSVFFFEGNILNPDLKLPIPMLDIIVSNPPYIMEVEKGEMHANVLAHEPHLALFVTNNDPLQFYKAIVLHASKHLKEGGQLYLEINAAYGYEVKRCLEHGGFISVSITKDMQGNDRMVSGTKG
jgi:release factor glutamine methyltransferase